MSVQFLGPDPVDVQVQATLTAIAAGQPASAVEHRLVDCKEEPGRRGKGGVVAPGAAQNEEAAVYLAGEAACFANTPGGGALIVGVADDGTLLGTALDAEWLRYRVYQLSQNRLTVDVRETRVGDTRLLILRMPHALEPVTVRGRTRWRVADNCVDVDTATWVSGRLRRLGGDWSSEASGHTADQARAAALELARDLLRDARDPAGRDLAAASNEQLLTRLNAVTADGHLTNGAALLFIGRDAPVLDYRRRDQPGGDSRTRVVSRGRSVLEDLAAVVQAIDAYNPATHVRTGLVAGQLRALPETAIREALANAIAHRDWASPEPVTVEHVGNELTVTSPGGFIGGVNADNIITHPSQPRNRNLADILNKLGLAEREGIGVDRMVRDMIRFGHPAPVITEQPGPLVRAALVGSTPDRQWIQFLDALEPKPAGENLDILLLLNRLVAHGWVDAATAAPVLQKSVTEAQAALSRLADVSFAGAPLVSEVAKTTGVTSAYRLSDRARDELAPRLTRWRPTSQRGDLVLEWARHRGRVSTTEIADIVGTTAARAGQLLQELEDDGQLVAGRATRTGRGFFYRAATGEPPRESPDA